MRPLTAGLLGFAVLAIGISFVKPK